DPNDEGGGDEDVDQPEEDGAADEGDDAGRTATILGLLDGEEPLEDETPVVDFMPIASRLPPAAQARICDQLSRIKALSPDDIDALTVCAAEAADRSGDHEAAARAIGPALRLDDPSNPAIGAIALKAGMLSELTGHLDEARSRYEIAATYSGSDLGGLVRFVDLGLQANYD